MQNIDYTVIGKGVLFGSGAEGIEKGNLIITTPEQWNDLLTKLDAVNETSKGFKEKTIDFSSYTIVAIFESVKGSGGHSIDVKTVDTNAEGIVITTEKEGPSGMASSIMTQPFCIIKIPKSDLPVHIQ